MSERIAVISSSYPRQPGDAAGHFVASEVRRAVHAGHDVHVFAPGAGANFVDGATVHWLADLGAFGWPGALARIAERPTRALGALAFCVRAQQALFSEGSFTRVQAHFLLPCAWPIAAFGVRPGVALELVGHGSDVRLYCRLPTPLRTRIARSWLRSGARLRVTSQELAARLRAASPELDPVLSVRASPIDVADTATRAEARRSLNLPSEARIALVVARLVPGKRVASALHALALLDGLTSVVVGDGPELPALRERFPSVHFKGALPRPEALRYIAAADVLVSASEHEGAPSVVREARALGVPVVAVTAGDLARWAQRDPGLRLVAQPSE